MNGRADDTRPPPRNADEPVLLEGALVVTLDGERRVGPFTVAVVGDRIDGVLGRAAARRAYPSARRVNCRGRVLLPGLVNAHLHPDLHVLKGVVEDVGLHDWGDSRALNGALAVLNTPAGRPLQRASIRASLADAVMGGTTTIATYGVSAGSEAACADALLAFGIRGAVTIRDAVFPPEPPALPPAAASGLRGPVRFYRLHAEEALDAAELEGAAAAHARGARIVMHAAETRHRVDLACAGFGTTTIRLLHRYGLLSERVLLSHAVHVDDEERAMLAAAGAHVVASPAAEMKLGDGAAHFDAYTRAGITLALGTDAAVCNNGTDMLLECRVLGLLQKHAFGAGAMHAEVILLAATLGGAAALGLGGVIGAVVPGRAADLVLIDAANPRLQPLRWQGAHPNVVSNIVYAATGQDVTDVMIDGRWVVRRRRFLPADARTLWRELRDAARALEPALDR